MYFTEVLKSVLIAERHGRTSAVTELPSHSGEADRGRAEGEGAGYDGRRWILWWGVKWNCYP